MSDISIPGVSSKYNTQKLIEDLMKLERIPLQRMEERKENFAAQKKGWQDFNRSLSRLRDSSRKLFGHENPFSERIANSADPSIVTATASREAVEESRQIRVKQIASSDRFLSNSVSKDFRVPDGTYAFSVGEKEIEIRFRGGTLQNFASVLTSRSGGLLRASVVNDTSKTQVILVESTKTGSENRMEFKDESAKLAEQLGILKRNLTGTREFAPDRTKLQTPSGISENRSEGLYIGPSSGGTIPFSPPVKNEPGFFIEFEVTVHTLPEDSYTPPPRPQGPPPIEGSSVTLEGVTVFNEPSGPYMPEWAPPLPPERVDDPSVLSFTVNGVKEKLDDVSEGTQRIRIPLENFSGQLSSLNINNRNTHREIIVSPIRVYNPDLRGEYIAANPVDNADDAIVEIDGIEIIRPTNDIDDIIQGVTINLHEAGDKKVKLDIEPDRELVKNTIIQFVAEYNSLMTEINILTARDPSVIDEITYFTEDERESSEKKLGLFSGDTTLMQIKSHLQRIMMNPYETSLGGDFSLLAQAGISSNSSGFGGGFDAARMRGYLEINEQHLDETLKTKLDSLKELFGKDSDNDMVVDMGAAFSLDQTIYPYTRTGGIMATKTSTIDSQITRTNREIETFSQKLERIEQDLKRKYGMMEGMIEGIQKNSSALDNLSNTNK